MSDLEELRDRLRNHRPVPWEQLPDFALYMDQVLSYMDRQVIRFPDDDVLTSAMVNNYTKSGLVPRAEGKKYGREHLAYLTAICILKRVMSTRDMDLLIRQELQSRRRVRDGYAAFCDSLDKALRITLSEVEAREQKRGRMAGGNGGPEIAQAAEGEREVTEPEKGRTAENDSESTGTEREPERDSEGAGAQKSVVNSLADNAIHFALLSYAAGIASHRYVALLRKTCSRPEGQPTSKTPRRDSREPGKTPRRNSREPGKAAKRAGKASEKAARREPKM